MTDPGSIAFVSPILQQVGPTVHNSRSAARLQTPTLRFSSYELIQKETTLLFATMLGAVVSLSAVRQRQRRRQFSGRCQVIRSAVAEVDVLSSDEAPAIAKMAKRASDSFFYTNGVGLIPPSDARNRLRLTRSQLGREVLAYIGDTVWEFLVLRHQYMQVVRSPFTKSQSDRTLKQAKAGAMLFHSQLLTDGERVVLVEGGQASWKRKVETNLYDCKSVGIEQYSMAIGMRALLGWLYIDAKGSDERLDIIAREVGLLADPGFEDDLLTKLTEGIFDASKKPQGNFFLALAPLGHVALRLYVCRYLCQRPPRPDEFIYRVKLALRDEELDLAAVGFLRDDATAEEAALMQAARDQKDSYGFAFECLLGHLALKLPYRLHQVISNFGWAEPLPGT